MVVTGDGVLGFDSGEGALEMATVKEGISYCQGTNPRKA